VLVWPEHPVMEAKVCDAQVGDESRLIEECVGSPERNREEHGGERADDEALHCAGRFHKVSPSPGNEARNGTRHKAACGMAYSREVDW
jgi:hypothetical protein